jgi:hypothetical protein
MGKATFTKGFANERLAEGRAPMVARLCTGDTVIDFETSFPKERAWKVYNFLVSVAREEVSPKDAFEKAFNET